MANNEIKDINGYKLCDEKARQDIADIVVPTKTSELTNDSNFITDTEVDTKISNAQLGGESGGAISVNPWKGKVASFLGDSITYGVKTEKKYHEYLKELIGFSTVNNYGMDGSSITSHSNGMCTRYTNIDSASDIIFIFGGTNDFYYNKSLGEWYTVGGNTRTFNTDITTFRGALTTLCLGLITKFPNKQIILMTPIHRNTFSSQQTDMQSNASGLFLEDYVNCIIEAGKIFSIPVIDLYNDSGLFPYNSNNADLYFNVGLNDKLHPNKNGHLKIAKTIEGKLKSILPLDLNYTPEEPPEDPINGETFTIDDYTQTNTTFELDSSGMKVIGNPSKWSGVNLTNLEDGTYELVLPDISLERGQVIWYMYNKSDSDMKVLCIGEGGGENGKKYSLPIINNNPTFIETITLNPILKAGDTIYIEVSGSTQVLKYNETELTTLNDCNTIGACCQHNSDINYPYYLFKSLTKIS